MNDSSKRFASNVRLFLLLGGVMVVTVMSWWAAAATPTTPSGGLNLSLVPFASGLNSPVALVNAGDTRLFVVEQDGVIKIIQPNGTVLGTPFLDITGRVDSSQNEEGLLGLAFHPDYDNNGYFYVNYTHTDGSSVRRTRISRFEVTANPNVADPDSEEILLTVVQPEWNHNAGDIHFGPDGYLYIPLGDGGSGGDPWNNAQTMTTILGKINRIDVDEGTGAAPDCVGQGTGSYTIPNSNPFINGPGSSCDEIWAVGTRNPWRSSFDRQTGDFWIADVGQGDYEEINFQPASSSGGENYGWRCYEGNHPYNTSGCGPSGNYDFPIFEYSHTLGCSVSGGYVYRGTTYPEMIGHYFLADYCSGRFWDIVSDGGGGWTATMHTNLMAYGYASFGEDINGEMYVVNQSNGNVYRLTEDTVAGPILDITKSGPGQAAPGELITYTLTVVNSGSSPANNLVISDTVPVNATYISGGSYNSGVVTWNVAQLNAQSNVQVQFVVTATQTIVNDTYSVTSDETSATGSGAVTTTIFIASDYTHLPLVYKD